LKYHLVIIYALKCVQYVTICYNMLQYVTICYNMLQYVTLYYNMLQRKVTRPNIVKRPGVFLCMLCSSTVNRLWPDTFCGSKDVRVSLYKCIGLFQASHEYQWILLGS
jgi:hypothetical protein